MTAERADMGELIGAIVMSDSQEESDQATLNFARQVGLFWSNLPDGMDSGTKGQLTLNFQNNLFVVVSSVPKA